MLNVAEHSLSERHRYWLDHLRACAASGKSMRAYATENGIGARALYDAKKRLVRGGVLAAKGGGVEFARAQVMGTVVRGDGCRVEFPNGITVTFGDGLQEGALLGVLRAVATLG